MRKSLRVCANFAALCLSSCFWSSKITGMLGVNVYTARKLVDAIAAGAGLWTLLALCLTGASLMAIVMASGKTLIKRFGKTAAISW
ncbi:hypothetical protein AOC36_00310 [Erysipelothrix larvae]|uniref:Circularin A/uberolysin family circular bacteriocin n=1 Tax=Erysipelothrix larvae TaxID=1514105 RepID=A0A0X8GYE5_9FIRM|nr:uberolysin/carnocyclin family circular bacteriocin [Erysipelothrix larvae]AMC92489.1 hypothetical protein AOC36_00310 [Erysipelothrix larvae]